MSLREYIIANVCDGQEAGLVTLRASDLADTVVEAVMAFLVGNDEATYRTLREFVGEMDSTPRKESSP